MKLYDFPPAANAQRVRVFLAEKGIELLTQELNVREDHQFFEPYTSMNPFHCVPFLELDDGTVIAESVTICRYLDETQPGPSLFGKTPQDRTEIDMWLIISPASCFENFSYRPLNDRFSSKFCVLRKY